MPELIEHHTWAPGPRLRVLVEAATWSTREQLTTILRRAGHDAAACPGPEGASQRCSLAAGHGCGAAEGCDVVVHALASWDPRNLEALRALRARLPDTPVVVETPAIVAARLPEELEGCIVVEPPLRTGTLLAAVERAVAGAGSTDGDDG